MRGERAGHGGRDKQQAQPRESHEWCVNGGASYAQASCRTMTGFNRFFVTQTGFRQIFITFDHLLTTPPTLYSSDGAW